MTTLMTTVRQWQEKFIDLVDRAEKPLVKAAGTVSQSVSGYVPERPGFMAQVPTMKAVVENQIEFTTKFVDRQAKFARHLVKAMEPATLKTDRMSTVKMAPKKTEARPVVRPAHKPVAKRPVRRTAPVVKTS